MVHKNGYKDDNGGDEKATNYWHPTAKQFCSHKA